MWTVASPILGRWKRAAAAEAAAAGGAFARVPMQEDREEEELGLMGGGGGDLGGGVGKVRAPRAVGADAAPSRSGEEGVGAASAPPSVAATLRLALLNPPIVVSLLSIGVSLTPPLQSALFSRDSEWVVLTDAAAVLGGAMIPCTAIVLGCNLASRDEAAGATAGGAAEAVRAPALSVVLVVLARGLVTPAACALVEWLLHSAGALGATQTDPLFRLCLGRENQSVVSGCSLCRFRRFDFLPPPLGKGSSSSERLNPLV